jgi:hypothetical protein
MVPTERDRQMTYITATKTGPKGHQTGYVVKAIESGKIVATFTNKAHGYWRFAKTAAERECAKLNGEG